MPAGIALVAVATKQAPEQPLLVSQVRQIAEAAVAVDPIKLA
jgi:hypothetical protein